MAVSGNRRKKKDGLLGIGHVISAGGTQAGFAPMLNNFQRVPQRSGPVGFTEHLSRAQDRIGVTGDAQGRQTPAGTLSALPEGTSLGEMMDEISIDSDLNEARQALLNQGATPLEIQEEVKARQPNVFDLLRANPAFANANPLAVWMLGGGAGGGASSAVENMGKLAEKYRRSRWL